MSTVFLSPSLQDFNPYVTGNGSEKFFMQKLADAMIPYLIANGIPFRQSDENGTVNDAIRDSNAFAPSLHISLHSNASPEELSGRLQGPEIYYYAGSEEGLKAAQAIGNRLAQVYPYSDEVQLIPVNRELAELARTKSPAVFIEVAYHDNPQDAEWIEENTDAIAQAIVHGITDYFQKPFIDRDKSRIGRVTIKNGTLNVRSAPSENAEVIGSLRNGETVLILRTVPQWYYILGNNTAGYVRQSFISTLQ